jgi:hemerythrin
MARFFQAGHLARQLGNNKRGNMNNLKYNLWKPEYAVDVEEIDIQHKKFFEYCTCLIQLADGGSDIRNTNADLIHLALKLRAYAFQHFLEEEGLMLKYKYPQIVEHIREHNKYCIQIFSHIESDYNFFDLNISQQMDDESKRIARFLSDFSVGWLGQHIYSKDKTLGEYINSKRK